MNKVTFTPAKNDYRVIYKYEAMSIYRDFAGLDIISNNNELAQELFNFVFDAMQDGKTMDEAIALSGAKVVA